MKSGLVSNFERVLVYESPALQEKARQQIPKQKLNGQARIRLASVNKGIGEKEKPLDLQVKNTLFVLFLSLETVLP